ncbi:MAG: patatin-like phospholipase family protein [Bryobacterales bacterium]|nr:patatin-like phospholipase family protein [Bryobacterales bacterium]
MRKILSIDGGGIRGIIPALVLAHIEQRTGTRVSELFDLIAGTSTGGILALGLAKPANEHGPLYRASDLAALYEQYGSAIFNRPRWRTLLPSGNLLDEKYSVAGLEGVLKQYFGDTRLGEATTPVVVTAYETERRFPFFFRSERAREEISYNFRMADAARATSAAPTYFEPLRLDAATPADYYSLVDGGVFANNPALCAWVDARALFPGESEFLLVSLGTGALTRPIRYEAARHWGVARWAKPVLDIAFDGVSSTVDHQLRQLLPHRYHRLQPVLSPEQQDMDNASARNIRGLKLLAEAYIREREEQIEQLCLELLR